MLFCVKTWSEGNNNTARSGGDVRDRKQTQYQRPSARSTLEVCSQPDAPGVVRAKWTTAAALLQVFCPNSQLLSRARPGLVLTFSSWHSPPFATSHSQLGILKNRRPESLTYSGLFKQNGGVGRPQGVDGGHVNFVGEGGEDLGKENAAAVLVVGIFGHLQRLLVVSGNQKHRGESQREEVGFTSRF